MKIEDIKLGGRYNWINQDERLVYLGYNFSGNGYWHQFALVAEPHNVWCEVKNDSLPNIEETKCPNESGSSIRITMEITDPETVEEYSKCDDSFIVDDLLHGNLMKMCNVTSIKSNDKEAK